MFGSHKHGQMSAELDRRFCNRSTSPQYGTGKATEAPFFAVPSPDTSAANQDRELIHPAMFPINATRRNASIPGSVADLSRAGFYGSAKESDREINGNWQESLGKKFPDECLESDFANDQRERQPQAKIFPEHLPQRPHEPNRRESTCWHPGSGSREFAPGFPPPHGIIAGIAEEHGERGRGHNGVDEVCW